MANFTPLRSPRAFQLYNLWVLFFLLEAHTFAVAQCDKPRTQSCLEALQVETPSWRPIEGHGNPENWGCDGYDGATYYDKDFAELYQKLGIQSISHLLSHRKSQGQKNHVLDVFGSGFYVEDRSLVDSITGIRFGPFSRESTDPYIMRLLAKLPPTPTEILGDATHPQTWAMLKESMKSRNIPSINIAAMRPEGGWQRAPFAQTANQNVLAVSLMVENVLLILSEDGQFYFSVNIPQVPGDIRTHPVLQQLVRRLEEETRFHLYLTVKMSTVNTTYQLSGVIYPK